MRYRFMVAGDGRFALTESGWDTHVEYVIGMQELPIPSHELALARQAEARRPRGGRVMPPTPC